VKLLTDVDPDEARRRAHEILSRKEFQPPRPGVIQRFLSWLGDRIARLFSFDLGGGGGGGGLVNLVVTVVLIAALLVGLFFVGRAAVRWWPHRKRRSHDTEPDEGIRVVIDRSREPRTWRDEADAHASAGRWKEALRCRYRALVGDLARRGLLDEIPGRTTGEERMQLREVAPAANDEFSAATDLFDRAWYGDEPTGPTEHDAFRKLEANVLERTAR